MDGIGIDTGSDIDAMAALLPDRVAVQGNLDPLALVAGGDGDGGWRRPESWRRCRGGRSSSTSDMGSCRRPRRSMWPRCWIRFVPARVRSFEVGAPERGDVRGEPSSQAKNRGNRLGSRVAIVLFNLGGPDSPEAIKPFLLNLFRDPAILRVPPFVRPFLARYIARARVKPATENYALLGGKSPLLGLTQQQATALEAALPELDAKCFIAMRYWHPFSLEAARAVKEWGPDRVVLLPLYPQYSTTTTGSSLRAWREAAARVGLMAPVTTLCCYPVDPGFAAATAAPIRAAYADALARLPAGTKLRVLFSAHGLPEVIVRAGDPYQWQVEQTVAAVLSAWGEVVDWTHLLPVPRHAAEMARSKHGRRD